MFFQEIFIKVQGEPRSLLPPLFDPLLKVVCYKSFDIIYKLLQNLK